MPCLSCLEWSLIIYLLIHMDPNILFILYNTLNPFALIAALSDSLMALNRDDATNGRVLVQFSTLIY